MKSTNLLLSTFLLLVLVAGPGQSSGTAARKYMAPIHDSKWMATEEKDECLLQHEIPGFGNTKLRQSYREPLSFELNITQEVSLGTQCQVEITPPPWRHNIPTQSLGTIKIVPDAKHLQAKGGAAQKIYQGLEAGMMTSFNCEKKNTPLTKVKVVISPVRYLMALPDFQKCAAVLASKKKTVPKPAKTTKTKAAKKAKKAKKPSKSPKKK